MGQTSAQKRETADRNKQLQEQLKMVKLQNEELANRKSELTQEMKKAKEELGLLIEKGEQQKGQFMKEIGTLRDMERKLAETRDKEKKQFEEVEKTNGRKIQGLSEALGRKEQEIEGLKRTLEELNEREQQRMEELEKEAEFFKNILKNY